MNTDPTYNDPYGPVANVYDAMGDRPAASPLDPLLALSPCPFCGGAAKRTYEQGGDHSGYRYVVTIVCTACGGRVSVASGQDDKGWNNEPNDSTDRRAIIAWNHREPDPAYWQNQHAAALRVIDELRAANARGDGVERMVEDLRVAAADAGNVIENVLWNCTLSDHYNERLNWALNRLGQAYAASTPPTPGSEVQS